MSTISGTAGDDVLIGTDGEDRFDLSQGGNDTVTGLAGDDVIRFGGAFTAADQINGGAGSDTLVLDGDYTGANQFVFSPTTLTHVETIRLAADHDYSLTLDEVTVASGRTLTVDGGALGAGGSLYLDAHNDTDGKIIGIGGSGSDSFYGGSGTNIFHGRGGNDWFEAHGSGGIVSLYGGLGDDIMYVTDGSGTLFGGRGDDVFAAIGDYEVHGGAGNDDFDMSDATIAAGMLYGGKGGLDILELAFTTFDVAKLGDAMRGFEVISSVAFNYGDAEDNKFDFSRFVIGGQLFLFGLGGDDVLKGADGFERFYGGAGDDRIYGGADTDELDGGSGHNRIYGGDGDDNLGGFIVFSDGPGGHTAMYGGNGSDSLFAADGRFHVYGGEGDDFIGLRNTVVKTGSVDGGNGIDHLDLSFTAGVVFDADIFDSESIGIEHLTGGNVIGSGRDNVLDFSDFTLDTAAGVSIEGGGGHDVLTGTYSDDTLIGGTGDDFLNGTAGGDTLNGSRGNDGLNGGLGRDVLTGGKGADTFSYLAAAESTGADHDTIAGFDAAGTDAIDVWFTVTGIDPELASGSLSSGSIDADLAAAIGAAQLAPNHAVLFTPDTGDLAGRTVLVIDANGTAGYQSGGDLVLFLDGAKHLRSLDVTDFG